MKHRGYLVPAAAVVAWSLLGLLHHRAIAGPIETSRAIVAGLVDGSLLADVGATAARAFAGITAGLVVGVPLGLGLGSLGRSGLAIEPSFDFLRAIPPLLVLPLFMLAFGYGDEARVLTVAWAVTLVVSLQVAAGVRGRHRERARALRAMGATRFQRMRWLDVFETLPHLFAGARQASSIGLVVAVVAEMVIGAPAGLGTRAMNAQVAYDAPGIWASIVLTGLLGFGVARAILGLERRVVHWREDLR